MKIDKVRAQLKKMKDNLRTVASLFDWSHIANTFNIKTINGVKEVLDYKIPKLLGSTLTHDPKKAIYNFFSHVLSQMEKKIFCKCLNFAIPPKKVKVETYLLPFEILF